jgi:hypothetical protein
MDKQRDRYAMELQRHGVESVEREVRWLSELINAERRDDESARHPAPLPTAQPLQARSPQQDIQHQ